MIKITSGITPKGTIFIREINQQTGKLLRKRVVNKRVQFDAKMSDKQSGKCSQILKTDWNKNGGEQTLLLPPKKLNPLQTLCYKLFNKETFRDGEKNFAPRKPIKLVQNSHDEFYNGYVKMIQEKTGYSDININREMANLKTDQKTTT